MSWRMKVLTEEEVRVMEPALALELLRSLCSQIPNERLLASHENEDLLMRSIRERLNIPTDVFVTRDQITAALYKEE